MSKKSCCPYRSSAVERLAFGGLALLAALGAASVAVAAPCCGGGGSIPSLITGDDRAQLQTSLSYGNVIGDAPVQGIPVFRADGDSETTQVFRLDGAYRVSDRFQLGAGVPVVRRARAVDASSADATGLGDVVVGAAYEALPEWAYSAWKPRGFVFVQSTLPTSPSTYDAVAPYQLDARGRGFFTLGGGAVLLKNVSNFDLTASAEGHRSFRRTVTGQDGGALTLIPGFGASGLVGVGYSPAGGGLRVGLSLSPVWEAGIASQGDIVSRSASQLVWNTGAQIGYAIGSAWSASVSYVDQTLVGPARNVALSRSVAAALQRRWEL